MLGDEGSGYSIGRAALREALLVGEGRSEANELAGEVLARAEVKAPDDLLTAVYHPEVDKAWIAGFAPLVMDAAESGDAVALGLLDTEASMLGTAGAAGIDVLGHDDATLGLFGGTFSSGVWRASLQRWVTTQTDRRVSVVVPRHTALVGAYSLAVACAEPSSTTDGDQAADRVAVAVDRRANNSAAKDEAP